MRTSVEELLAMRVSDRARLLTFDAITLTQREFEALPEYSCSLPTGTTPGKRWKRAVYSPGYGMLGASLIGWVLGEYGQQLNIHAIKSVVPITWYRIARIRCSL